ncbi:MAG: ImmA/IrrE family metallo-endopeptidase [Rhodospirillales bacterium]|nr:ImmA/IrrE family metallo-endopeptidase [Rhodospirillales bacterium]
MSEISLIAPPISRPRLRAVAQGLRDLVQPKGDKFVDVVQILESGFLGLIAPGFEWRITDRHELPLEHGLTDFSEKFVIIREDVYEGAIAGQGRDRLTVVHEIGHAILHNEVKLARPATNAVSPKRYQCPEWQANCFAGEFLLDVRELTAPLSIEQISQEFGVSVLAAKIQLNAYQRENLIDQQGALYWPTQTKSPKSGGNHFSGFR